MSEDKYFKFSNAVLVVPLVAVLTIWLVFWLELSLQVNLHYLGIYPRTLSGLKGVVLSPLIHGSVEHLYNNTIPIAILLGALVYFYQSIYGRVLLWGILISGLVTWTIGRPSYHIGISGLIYVLVSFIFFKGIFTKHYRLVALSLVVVFIYGGLLWYIFPIEDGISWEGHLGGFVAGLVLASTIRVHAPPVKKYDWEQDDFNEENDPFLRHFDADGNFIEHKDEQSHTEEASVKITYHFRKSLPEEGKD
ncbi:rhomboid family intramembrane serine protease [Flavobacteriaceae bacterium KMM 6897]|nr:rhomboid family intramembrane serine protease [Flavobacteriaceae bacterium KMM 6897]MEB8344975.1 rhomboid family intramembrane serine protease [Flavobacteriaceae bacterium KMM 6898]